VNLDLPFTGSGCLSFERRQDSETGPTGYASNSARIAIRLDLIAAVHKWPHFSGVERVLPTQEATFKPLIITY
jgi:hypothetical protein